jgi:hypothetical protein
MEPIGPMLPLDPVAPGTATLNATDVVLTPIAKRLTMFFLIKS